MTQPDYCDAARELQLWANNTEAWIKPAWLTLGKFHKAGTYNKDRAIAYLDRYVLTPAAKQYRSEFGGMGDRWQDWFPKACRLAAAESMADSMVAEFRLGNYWEA